MKIHLFLACLLLLLPGCAAYKELQPEPELSPFERGYIELKDGEENFELSKGNKYFIRFPAPPRERFYLVLVTRSKPMLSSFLTGSFNDGQGPMTPISDEASASDSISVYTMDGGSRDFVWVIDAVREDLVLGMNYRYVPQWRYTFENKYAGFRTVLANNIVDRSTYNSIDGNFSFDNFDFTEEISQLDERNGRLKSMKADLQQLESVFPPDIAAAKDTAYEKYVALRTNVDEELAFQETYGTALHLFQKEKETRGNTAEFLTAIPYFTEALSHRDRFTSGVISKVNRVFPGRLGEVVTYLDGILKNKTDAGAITPDPSLENISALYRACGQQTPGQTASIVRFINRFNVEVKGLQAGRNKLESLRSFFNSQIASPSPSFYSDLVAKAEELKSAIPECQTAVFERYGSYPCATMLGREIASTAGTSNDLLTMYQGTLAVSNEVGSHAWGSAETHLRELHDTRGTSGYPEIPVQRTELVKRLEANMFSGVKSASEQRIDAFINAHQVAIDSVAQLYADSSFLPVYQLTFGSSGQADLMQKRKQIESYLESIKYNQFPETSIKSIYAEFSRNPTDRGVEKARAIVEHGKFYKGADKQVKGLITECDVQAAKWVIKPKEYRKLFALPVTSNKKGMNQYMFRIRLQVPSEAQFPVFDVNLKLPREVAEKAGQAQWYESITIDKKPLKNEGRFRITSPTAENEYEALITPLQMDKEGRNILEVRFSYPGFRVFDVSAMVQVPIIRKN